MTLIELVALLQEMDARASKPGSYKVTHQINIAGDGSGIFRKQDPTGDDEIQRFSNSGEMLACLKAKVLGIK